MHNGLTRLLGSGVKSNEVPPPPIFEGEKGARGPESEMIRKGVTNVKTIFGKRNVRCDGPVLAHSTNFITLISQKIITPPCRGAEYCNECACLSVCPRVCPRSYLRNYTSDLHHFLWMLPMAVARSSWRRSDMLCTSRFVDDVIFAHKSRLLDVAAQLRRSAHAALGLAINCAQ